MTVLQFFSFDRILIILVRIEWRPVTRSNKAEQFVTKAIAVMSIVFRVRIPMKNQVKLILATSLLAMGAANSYAIPVSYGVATHQNASWQKLDDLSGDGYGVSWSTDGGLNWGREAVNVGDSLSFRMDMHKDKIGSHYADFAKLWVDWGQDGTFDSADETLFGMHVIHQNPVTAGQFNYAPNPADSHFSFISPEMTIDASFVGDYLLRARVVCSESLYNSRYPNRPWSAQWSLSEQEFNDLLVPTGKFYQGEVEEWKLTVNAVSASASSTSTSVPEPGIALIFAAGALAFSASRKKR